MLQPQSVPALDFGRQASPLPSKISCHLWPRFPLYRVEALCLPAKWTQRKDTIPNDINDCTGSGDPAYRSL